MSTTVSMTLGIAFLLLAIVAVFLQAWLWGPKFWDEEAKVTRAPKFWLRMHAIAGYTYGLIYLVMMWEMVPRMWEYQYELPARTVIHAVVAITIGVLLITKILILMFFRHFEESMPKFGFGLLLCTVIISFLSLPFSLRAIDPRAESPENLERVASTLADVDMSDADPNITVEDLATVKGLRRGRNVLMQQCVSCHDMRTILIKPRTANNWYQVNMRMLEKPSVVGEPLLAADIPYVTAYLVAITPEIQRSTALRRQQERAKKAVAVAVAGAPTRAGEGEEAGGEAPAEDKAIELDAAAKKELMETRCAEDCHEMDEIESYGGGDVAEWTEVIARMVEEGAELEEGETEIIAAYLAEAFPKE